MILRVPKWEQTDARHFVDFWAQQYSDRLEHLYEQNINRPLTEERVWSLFRWKNGTERIARQKAESIQTNYLAELGRTPVLRNIDDGRAYLAQLRGGPIWNIFWLHCLRPELFPIFDQHTYRAMACIEQLEPRELPDARRRKIEIYLGQFIPFRRNFGDADLRSVDKALFAYGRFLKWGFAGR